ncbi:MAG: MBOAT family protein [Butyrivibrio sp.]|nr:MBOAT family protein [Butyrivibrio sp.]
MLFNSFEFILLFMPIMLIGWYGLNKIKKYKIADIFLIIMSLIFYMGFGLQFTVVLIVSVIINYIISLIIKNSIEKEKDIQKLSKRKMTIKIIGILFNLGILFYFKYLDFFIENVNNVTGLGIELLGIVMPIGISFYSFQQIAFICDRANGEQPHYNMISYFMSVFYFPKIIQGPITYCQELIEQFDDKAKRTFNSENFNKGMILFVIGLSKKVLLADNLSKVADYGFKYTYYMDTVTVIVLMLSYAFQLYFDFSGYCDMAEGVSQMLGIKIPGNFNSPYKAASIKELWQRWHITLSRFFIRYVYIPLGGSRKGKTRTLINVLIIFILSGLWHGAGWTYMAWGLMQGILVCIDNIGIFGIKGQEQKFLFRKKALVQIPRWLGQIGTNFWFIVSLIFFRSQDMAYAAGMFKRFFFWTWPGFFYRTAGQLDIPENYLIKQAASILGIQNADNIIFTVTLLIFLIISIFVITRKNAREIANEVSLSKLQIAGLSILFVWSFISMSQVSTFIYFAY